MLEKLTIKETTKPKTAFWASDYGKALFDVWANFKQIPKTNPTMWFDTLKMAAGKGVEMAMLKVLQESGIVAEDYSQETAGRIDVEREGVRITGYVDAITLDGCPIEIKSINNANEYDIARYERREPKENYVGQLAIYLDALDKEKGYLFVSSVDGLHRFWFDCQKIGYRKYKCGEIIVDLDIQYKKWAEFYKTYVLGDQEFEPDYVYKYDIDKVDWKSLSAYAIGQARNNKKVIGDWQVSYSPWKNLIIEKQGTSLGYTDQELERIKELTSGYTSKEWKK